MQYNEGVCCYHSLSLSLSLLQSQQKVEVWNVNVERHPLLCSIKAHTRPVRYMYKDLVSISPLTLTFPLLPSPTLHPILYPSLHLIWMVNTWRVGHTHTYTPSDLSWSFTDPNLLASCAVDSFVHVWDIRWALTKESSINLYCLIPRLLGWPGN